MGLGSRDKSVETHHKDRACVHFLHVGKTGGTAIKNALRGYEVTDEYLICLHSHRVKLPDVPRGQKVMFFVRDPMSRFVSGFYSRKRRGEPAYSFSWNRGERRAFETFDTPDQLGTALSSKDDGLRQSAETAMQAIEHVRTSFWDWFGSEDYFLSRKEDIIFVGSQESLSRDFEVMKSKLGVSGEVVLPKDDLNAHRNPKDLDRSLGDVALANLSAWYEDDYHFLRLCRRHGLLGQSESSQHDLH